MDASAFLLSVNGTAPWVNPGGSWNGSNGSIKLDQTVEHVKPENKLVLDKNDQMDLSSTLQWVLYKAQGSPNAALAVTAAHLDAAKARISDVVNQYELLSAYAHTTMVSSGKAPEISYRASDVISSTAFATLTAASPGLLALKDFADRMVASTEAMEKFTTGGEMTTTTAVFNALHRDQCDGHSCLTRSLRKEDTPTGKMTRVFGSKREVGIIYLERIGHDLWHSLTNDTLSGLVDAITGYESHTVDNGYVIGGVTSDGTTTLDAMIGLGDAVIDRWPPGTVGLGALMVGLNMTKAMIAHMAFKICPAPGSCTTSDIQIAIEEIQEYLEDSARTRDDILNAKQTLGGLICSAFGYCSKTKGLREMSDDHPAIAKMAEVQSAQKAVGVSLAEWVEEQKFDNTAIKSSLTALVNAVSKYASTIGVTAPNAFVAA